MSVQTPQPPGFLKEWEQVTIPTAAPTAPWKLAVATSLLGAVASWTLDGISQRVREKRRRR